MDSDWLLALSTMILSFTVVCVVVFLYIRLGRLETLLKAGRERANGRHAEARERSDEQFRVAWERSDTRFDDMRGTFENLFRKHREQLDAQFAQ